MKRYILNPSIALRSWRLVPYAYYIKGVREAKGLKKDEFEFLLKCDGKTEAESPLAEKFLETGFISPAKEGDRLSEWQKHLDCDNRYFPAMNLEITGKCNFNCLHCFNAADNAPLSSEWTLKEVKELITQAQKCGINAVTITDGEPMLHKNFFGIIEEIYAHGMYVYELNTNGYFIDQTALDRLKNIGCFPAIKISFDGIGHHDWLRNCKGAEEKALEAIRLCRENGFCVWAQTNVHRLNVDTMLPTARVLDKIGVHEMRIIRTTESLRWRENAGDACLGIEEYYDKMFDFAAEYSREEHDMEVDIWQFLTVFPKAKAFRVRPVECAEGEYRDSMPVCRGNRGTVAIAADGYVYPCMPMSGYYSAKGDFLGNVKKDGLQSILQQGKYLSEICTTVGQLAEKNRKCRECAYFKYCAGGCRVLATLFTEDKLGSDPAKCVFFEKGYYEKITALFKDWKNLKPIGGK